MHADHTRGLNLTLTATRRWRREHSVEANQQGKQGLGKGCSHKYGDGDWGGDGDGDSDAHSDSDSDGQGRSQ